MTEENLNSIIYNFVVDKNGLDIPAYKIFHTPLVGAKIPAKPYISITHLSTRSQSMFDEYSFNPKTEKEIQAGDRISDFRIDISAEASSQHIARQSSQNLYNELRSRETLKSLSASGLAIWDIDSIQLFTELDLDEFKDRASLTFTCAWIYSKERTIDVIERVVDTTLTIK